MLRYSETLAKQTFYYAILLEDGKILRVSRSIDSVLGYLQSGDYTGGCFGVGNHRNSVFCDSESDKNWWNQSIRWIWNTRCDMWNMKNYGRF